MAQSKYSYQEFSGALQLRSTTHIRKPNEVRGAKNTDFWAVLGAMQRRKGAQATKASMPKLPLDTRPLGAHIAHFSNIDEIWAAQDDVEDTPTKGVLYRFTGPAADDWAVIDPTDGGIADLVAGSEVNMEDDLDEVWVSSYNKANDTIGDPFTVDSSHDPSTQRHLEFAPKGRFYIEFNGAMWAADVLVGSDRYKDRLYKSSGPTGVFAYVRSSTTLAQTQADPQNYAEPLEVDSVRYIKPGMIVDIYQAGTDTKLYTLEVDSVDKALDTVTFIAPDSLTFADTDINVSTNVITITDVDWLTTGTPVTFWQGSSLPAGLTQGAQYYVRRITTTTIKLYNTREDAANDTNPVDITDDGSGTHRITFTPIFGNKDEFWKTGRKGKLSRFWNTDYRTPETSDYLKLPSTLDGNNAITGVGKLTGRMFVFTENAMMRYDGQNFQALRNDVGCISHKTICYYDSFMVWLDAKGNVWIRNDESGEQDVISEPVQPILESFTREQLKNATAICTDNIFKLYVGDRDGRRLRLVYNFRTNQWADHYYTPEFPEQLEYIYQGSVRAHFFDENGQMWVDDEGTDDDGEVIPWEPYIGDDNFMADEQKSYKGVKIYSRNAKGCKIMVSIDNGQPLPIGQIENPVQSIMIPKSIPKGTMINFLFKHAIEGATPRIDKVVVWFNTEEDTFRATPR